MYIFFDLLEYFKNIIFIIKSFVIQSFLNYRNEFDSVFFCFIIDYIVG